jgi:hypothetical protein
VAFGVAIGVADYQVNLIFRLPLAEAVILIYCLSNFEGLSRRQIFFIAVVSALFFFFKIVANSLVEAADAMLKIFLLILNMVLIINAYKARPALMKFFAGIAIGWVCISIILAAEGNILNAKFIFPNLLPLALFFIFANGNSSKYSKALGVTMIIVQLAAMAVLEFRSQMLGYGVLLFLILLPTRLFRGILKYAYILPLVFMAGGLVLINMGLLAPDSDLSTRSNVERAVLLSTAFEQLKTMPLIGMSTESYLHGVDLTLQFLTADELSTTSAHNLYADIIIQFGVVVLIAVIYVLRKFCNWYYINSGECKYPITVSLAFVVIFLIFSLTPVSASSRVELLWLVAIIGSIFSSRIKENLTVS